MERTLKTTSVIISWVVLQSAGMTAVLPAGEHQRRPRQEIQRIGQRIREQFSTSPTRPDYPMVRDYRFPAVRQQPLVYTQAGSDSTPPVLPDSLMVTKESVHSFFVSWIPASDPESGIEYYSYALGSQPGAADIRGWQSVGSQTRTYPASLRELGLAEGDSVYVAVQATNGAGLLSDQLVSDAIPLRWEDLGRPDNALTVVFSDYGFDATGVNVTEGWRPSEVDTIQHFLDRMLPIITEVYGPPSHGYTVTLVKNLWYVGSNIFFSGSNEIHMSDFYPQLLTHELIHAYHDNVILSTDDNWSYHPELSGFEESFAQGVSYICMNRYVELYPNDMIVDQTFLFGSSMDWDYDYRNVPAITTQDFWSDAAGMGLYWERYELGAAAMRKIHLEDPDFFRKFNQAYYARLNADHALTTSRDLVVDIISSVVAEVEMQPTEQWISRQHIFDCRIEPGRKIWVRTQHYPWDEFIIFQRIYYYETFENGSDWAYNDSVLGDWVYHSLNGSSGSCVVYAGDGSQIWQGNLLIEPTDNPPVFFGFGNDEMNFSTDADLQPWPLGDPGDYLLGMHDLSLYRFDIEFDTTSFSANRVIGDSLKKTTGVFGGIRNAGDGVIYLNHEDFPEEPPLTVKDGAFWGERLWASVPNPLTGGTDSRPGRVSVKFVQDDGKVYLAQRNIEWGSWNGNQAFLFDADEMIPDTTLVSTVQDPGVPDHFEVFPNYPNPFNPATEITYRLPDPGKVDITVFNLLGQRVRALVSEAQEAGLHKITWDATDDRGSLLSGGTYFYLIEAGSNRFVGKMLLLR